VLGAVQELIQEPHRTWSMGEPYQAGMVNGGDQDTSGDSDGFLHVIVLELPAIRKNTITLREDHDQVRSILEKGFVLIGAERSKSVQPFLCCLVMIKLVLFLLYSDANLLFDDWIGNNYEVPGLHVGTVRRRAGCEQTSFDHLQRHRLVRDIPYSAAALNVRKEVSGAALHLFDGMLAIT
jgi:hypothetical protein